MDVAAAQQSHTTFNEHSMTQFLQQLWQTTITAQQQQMCPPYMFGENGYPRYCPTYQAPGVGPALYRLL